MLVENDRYPPQALTRFVDGLEEITLIQPVNGAKPAAQGSFDSVRTVHGHVAIEHRRYDEFLAKAVFAEKLALRDHIDGNQPETALKLPERPVSAGELAVVYTMKSRTAGDGFSPAVGDASRNVGLHRSVEFAEITSCVRSGHHGCCIYRRRS